MFSHEGPERNSPIVFFANYLDYKVSPEALRAWRLPHMLPVMLYALVRVAPYALRPGCFKP